ncbi:MAG: tRNA (adenosine(37)-N6)-threonylcarbamoyltransferase complex transferase subunit TsaD [Epsilonproteobacteria bacterium]|nr:tRNA (adenosine(37)-N6)-threonylcarbamoyltransferase complex transferase subunit TsaD [Campylobacterota bacterium]
MDLILSIESSCDDSSIALTDINSLKVIKHLKLSQEKEHKKYGGVVPELASRLHAAALPKLLEKFKPYFKDIRAVAVTTEPGLSVSLHEGVIMAKAISSFLEIPIISVNHLKGHIYSTFIEKKATTPLLALLLSGGHTQIIKVNSYKDMEVLATTMDDSVGEAYDKVAKMLNLGYPGGPIIEKIAKKGDENRFNFPIPLQNSPKIAFSLSGLKNAVRLKIEELGGPNMSEQDKSDIAASFQKAILKHLLQKSKKIFQKEKIKDFVIVGGVAANRYINEGFKRLCKEFGKNMHQVKLEYTSDNAAMIGRWGVEAYKNKEFSKLEEIIPKATKKVSIGRL